MLKAVKKLSHNKKKHCNIRVSREPFACWDCGFDSRRKYGYLYLLIAVCCQVEVSARGRFSSKGVLPTVVCPVSVILKHWKWGRPGPHGLSSQGKKSNTEYVVWDVTPYARQKFIYDSYESTASSSRVNKGGLLTAVTMTANIFCDFNFHTVNCMIYVYK
jgi:hypothetical protein